jgi:hypothetical protein
MGGGRTRGSVVAEGGRGFSLMLSISPRRRGGQKTKNALPMMFSRGTKPQAWLSLELSRWSPSSQIHAGGHRFRLMIGDVGLVGCRDRVHR